MNHEDNLHELHILAEMYCRQALDADDVRRLEELLRGNRALQLEFLAYTGMNARLQWEFGPIQAPAPRASVPMRRQTRPMLRVAVGLAASILIVALFGALSFLGEQAASERPVAMLADSVNAVWSDSQDWNNGTGLPAGRVRLLGGVAEIRFESGAVAVLEGPAELELVDPMHAYLHSGQVVLRVPPPAIGFVLDTPRARVLDLGTEFGVKVGGTGETEVQVYKGVVEAEFQEGDKQRLESGQAIRIARARPEELLFHPESFIRYLPGPDDPRGRRKNPYNDARFEELHIVPAPAGLVIDGDLADWNLSGKFHSACAEPYAANYHVDGAMMYDDKFLYVGAHVADPFPMRSQVSPHEERHLYGHGGCVALRLSMDRRMGWPARGEHADARNKRPATPADVSDKLAFVVFWFYEPEQLPCLHLRYGMDYHGSKVNPPGYKAAWKKDADGKGYRLEYALPWSLLNADDDPPQAGDTLGACWLVHWSDAAGRNWQGQLIDITNPKEEGWNFHRAATWGQAVYQKR